MKKERSRRKTTFEKKIVNNQLKKYENRWV